MATIAMDGPGEPIAAGDQLQRDFNILLLTL